LDKTSYPLDSGGSNIFVRLFLHGQIYYTAVIYLGTIASRSDIFDMPRKTE